MSAHLPARLPQRLTAPQPGWEQEADVVVVGSGIAGLTTALRLGAAPDPVRVLVVTKELLSDGSTHWAQGGIAAALGPGDSPQEHLVDTLVAGVGLCDEDAVRVLVTEGPDAVRELIALGTHFDHTDAGELSLTREGGHHRDRIAHAGGDATGAEIQRALVAAVRAAPGIELVEHALAVDLVPGRAPDGSAGIAGVTVHVMGEGQRGGVGMLRCRAVVLASGGLGQVFSQTTNPSVSTGDGTALALRAGAVVRDLEFVQFHPTVMWLGADAQGQQPLISEAVRGEGAVLVDGSGAAFMRGQHELADLAPRDVVAKAITRRMHEEGRAHVWLDARRIGGARTDAEAAAYWQRRFPTILATCRAHGVDPVTEPIPVAPACHYASGGVATDLEGRSSLPGLLATGEVACSGVHGANRLASNSLLEGLVFARRIAAAVQRDGLPPRCEPVADDRPTRLVHESVVPDLQAATTARVGVLRSAGGLGAAVARLGDLAATPGAEPSARAWEASNLVTVATVLARAALAREETRGSHWRDDHPERDDRRWDGHLDTVLRDGEPVTTWVPAARQQVGS